MYKPRALVGSEKQWDRLVQAAADAPASPPPSPPWGLPQSTTGPSLAARPHPEDAKPCQVLCFGEALLTFKYDPSASVPGGGDTATACLRAVGGSELNVAVALSRIGVRSAWASVLPTGGLGDDVIEVADGAGVDTSHVIRHAGDIGTLHLRRGEQAPLYQRSRSAFAEGADSLCPIWSHLASHASWPPWVVVTGITPLLGSSALSAWRALIHAAHSRGGRVSLDLNHRPALGSFGNLWGLVAPMLACVTLLVLSEGNVHTLAALLLKQEHGAGASGVQEQQGEGAPVGKENPGEASSSVDAADGSGRFWVLLSRLREVLGVPMLACSIKRPIPPPTRPNTHAATGTSTAPTALAVPSAGTACPPSGTAPLPPHSGTPSTDRRLPTRRWSLVATPTGVQSTFDMPTEHSPLEPLGGGDAWLAGFVSGILPQPGSECHDAGSGAALTTPASLASPATVAPLPARLQSALRRGDLLAALQQATHGDMSSVTKIGLDAAETRWHGRTAQMIPGGTAHEEQPAAAPQRTTRPSERSAMAAPQGGVNQHPHPDQLPNQDHPSDDTDTPNWHELRLRLRRCRLLPVISVDDPSDAVPLARALAAGGATVVEVVLRTPAAAEALSQIADHVPELMLGAGTVLTIEQAEDARRRGASFLVAPGLSPSLVSWASTHHMPMLPGVATPTDVTTALGLGLTTLKFFPADKLGGPAMIRALAAPFPQVEWLPSGGIGADTAPSYLALPSVLAVGGSWLAPAAAVAAHDWEAVTIAAKHAVTAATAAAPE